MLIWITDDMTDLDPAQEQASLARIGLTKTEVWPWWTGSPGVNVHSNVHNAPTDWPR